MKQHHTCVQKAATASGWPVWREGVNPENQPALIATLPASKDLVPFLREADRTLRAKADYRPPALTLLPPDTTDIVSKTVSLVITPAAGSTLQRATTLLECWGPRAALWTLCREAALQAAPASLLSLATRSHHENGSHLNLFEAFAIANRIKQLSAQTHTYPTCAVMLADRHLDREVREVFNHIMPVLAQDLPPVRPDPRMIPTTACYA